MRGNVMSETEPLLYVEIHKDLDKVMLEGNYEGLKELRDDINSLLKHDDEYLNNHGPNSEILMIPEWGGSGINLCESSEEWTVAGVLKIKRWGF